MGGDRKETDEKELLGIAIGLESKSEHPLAKAITSYAKENNIVWRGNDNGRSSLSHREQTNQ